MARGRPAKRKNLVENFQGKKRRLSDKSVDDDNIGQNERTVVLGSFNQGDQRFSSESRGCQCTPNACVALAYSEVKPLFVTVDGNSVVNWGSADLDKILTIGDNLYLVSIEERKKDSPEVTHPYFLFEELYKNVLIDDALLHFQDDLSVLDEEGQLLYLKQGQCSFKNVQNVLIHFAQLENASRCLFTCHDYSFGVFFHEWKILFIRFAQSR